MDKEINVKAELENPDSIFYYYQKLIQLRKEKEIIVYGSYDLLLPDSKEIYAYTRTLGEEKLLVVCNFSETEVEMEIPKEFRNADYLISNYETRPLEKIMALRPYESFVVEK